MLVSVIMASLTVTALMGVADKVLGMLNCNSVANLTMTALNFLSMGVVLGVLNCNSKSSVANLTMTALFSLWVVQI